MKKVKTGQWKKIPNFCFWKGDRVCREPSDRSDQSDRSDNRGN